MINAAPHKQMPANKYILFDNPINSLSLGKNFSVRNTNSHKMDIQNDTQPSLIFSGINSLKTTNGNESTPNWETNTTKANDTSGIQLNAVTSMHIDFSIMYTPKTHKPSAINTADVASNS